jgi:CubicO group peptidase (beta-lactamase class C family)
MGSKVLGIHQETLKSLMASPAAPIHGFYDEVMKKEMCFSLGFLKPNRNYPFGSPGAFGEPGAGGSFAFADPEAKLAYAYVTNQMGVKMGGDPRDLALREALHRALKA